MVKNDFLALYVALAISTSTDVWQPSRLHHSIRKGLGSREKHVYHLLVLIPRRNNKKMTLDHCSWFSCAWAISNHTKTLGTPAGVVFLFYMYSYLPYIYVDAVVFFTWKYHSQCHRSGILDYGTLCTNCSSFSRGWYHRRGWCEPGRKPLRVVERIPPWWYFRDNMEMSNKNTTLRTTV